MSGNSFHFSASVGDMGVMIPPVLFTDNGISQEISVAMWIKKNWSEIGGSVPNSGTP